MENAQYIIKIEDEFFCGYIREEDKKPQTTPLKWLGAQFSHDYALEKASALCWFGYRAELIKL
jgi:hypothetical protein